MAEEVIYKVKLNDEGTPALEQIEQRGGRAFDTLDQKQNRFIANNQKAAGGCVTLGNVVGGFIGGLAAGAFQKLAALPGKLSALKDESLQLYDTQIQAEEQLRHALETTGGSAGRTFHQLKEAAAAMQAKTTFGDETVLQAQTQLTAYRRISGAIFDRTLSLSADFAARRKTDLSSAVQFIGSALNEPLLAMRKLREAGVSFSAGQTQAFRNLIQQGKIHEAQLILLDQLEKNYGGSAQLAARLGLGPTKQLMNAYGDLKEELGARLMPLQQKFTHYLSDLVAKATDFVKIPTTQKLENERREVNLLTAELSHATTGYDRRKEIIQELQRIAPDVVKGINAEAVSYATLARNVEKYNRQKIAEIAFEKKKTAGVPLYDAAAEAKDKEREAQIAFDKEINRIKDRIRANKYVSTAEKNRQLGILYDEANKERIGATIADRFKGGAGSTISLASHLNKIGLDSRFYTDSFGALSSLFVELRNARQKADTTEFAVGKFEQHLQNYGDWLGINKEGGTETGADIPTGGLPEASGLTDAGLTAIQGDKRALTNLTIQIDKQIENVTFNDGRGEFRRDAQTLIDELKTALMTAVNDVNYMVE